MSKGRARQTIGKPLATIFAVCVAASALSVATPVLATPYTAYFLGTTTYYYDYTSNTYVGSNVGVSFSGWFTFDVANAEYLNSYADANYAYNEPYSISGCQYIVNGSCQSGYDFGTNAPVVTGYHIDASFGTIDPLASGSGVFDESYEELYRQFLGGAYGADDQYVLLRQQYQQTSTSTDTGSLYTSFDRIAELYPYSYTNLLLNGVTDFGQTPDLSAVAAGTTDFYVENQAYTQVCDNITGCASTYSPNSYQWQGTLTSIAVVAGEAEQVSEPGTLATLGIGLIGLGFVGRRRGSRPQQ